VTGVKDSVAYNKDEDTEDIALKANVFGRYLGLAACVCDPILSPTRIFPKIRMYII